jgi:hypothetical protein
MKRLFLLFATVLCLCAWNKAMAYDFSAANSDGDTIYYNITSSAPPLTVEVTYEMQYRGNYIGNIIIPDNVTNEGNTYSVTSIGEYAFTNCLSLTSITIPNSVTAIGEEAFSYCHALTSIAIPNLVTAIGNSAFFWCSKLISIDVDVNNSNYSSIDGVLLNKLQDTLLQYPGGKTGSYTIPNSVTSIGGLAFYQCSKLTSVIISKSVTSIGSAAFAFCYELVSVTISKSVTSIESSAFYQCVNLAEIYVKAEIPPLLDYDAFGSVSTTIPVHVPCEKETVYKNTSSWSSFSNITGDIPSNVDVQSNDATMGIVNIIQANTCLNDTAIIKATPNAGYRFLQWNDGNTENPRTVIVTQDITYTATFDIETGITDIEASALTIYPNPATDNISITLPENISQAFFTLYDMQGKILIKQEVGNKETVTVNNLASGIYIYSVRTDKQNHTGKLIRK